MTNQVQVQTGFAFPSAGVRILIPLVVAAYIEKLSGISMYHMSDYNAGSSIGVMAAAAFSRQEAENALLAQQVLQSTFVTAYAMFNRDTSTVALNNLRRDIAALGAHTNNRVVKGIISYLERSKPTLEDSRYDPKIMEAVLLANFGAQRVNDIGKAFFAAAHCLNDGRPTLFTNVSASTYPSPPDHPLFMHNIPTHGDVTIVDAVMAATAIPGLIGHWHIESLDNHFMDAGSFAAQSFFCVMRDMHDIAYHQALTAHATKLSARGVFQRLTNKPPAPPELASRMVLFGIGDEVGIDFDRTNQQGILPQIGSIMKAASDHGRGYAEGQIRTRFDKVSIRTTGSPALRVIDARITPQNDAERSWFPSQNIVDGRFDNLMRLLQFGKHVITENSGVICDEIILRLNELERRGLKTAEEIAAITAHINQYRTPEAATALCASILPSHTDAENLLIAQGLMPQPLPQTQAANDRGWILPNFRRIGAMFSF